MLFRIIILMFTLFLKANTMVQDINISNLSVLDQIEKITYANHKSILKCVEKQEIRSYIPPNDSYIIQIKPIVLHNIYGTMYLYDLRQKGKFLNAYVFDQLDIDANLSNVTIGLADGRHAEREDHLTLKHQTHINLKEVYKKIDLSQLQYFIVIDKKNENFHLNSLKFSIHKKNKKVSKNISSWLWKANKLNMQKVQAYKFHRLYVQMNQKDFPNMLKKIPFKNLEIYGLNGAPSDVNDYRHLFRDIDMLAELKKSYPFIKGYQIDIEPYLLVNFDQNKNLLLRKYMKMVKELMHYSHQRGLQFSVVIPFWFDTIFIDNQNLGFYVCDTADEIVLMSYRSDLNKVISISRVLLSYANYIKKDIRIGIELMKIEDEKHQIFKITNTKMTCLTPKSFSSDCVGIEQVNEYLITGDSISFYNQLYNLKALFGKTIPYASFKGYVLHHFEILPKKSFIQRKD